MARILFTVSILCTMFLLVITNTCGAVEQSYSYYKSVELIIGENESLINSNPTLMDQPAYEKNGRTLVPFRFLGEALGADILWDAKANQATLKLGDKQVMITVGSKVAYVNNELETLDVPAELKNNRLFVPLRFMSESLGAVVSFNTEDSSILIRCVDTSAWEWYTAPKSGIKYLHPKDWTITTESDDELVIFSSPNGSVFYTYWTPDSPETCYTELKKLAAAEDWYFENEILDVPNNVNEGFELQYSRFDTRSGLVEWYTCFVDKFNNNNSILGECITLDPYFLMDTYIMNVILFS